MCKRLVFLSLMGLAVAAFAAAPAFARTIDVRIAGGNDDAEEHLNAGMDVGSSDLEIIDEDPGSPATDEQLVGMRWLISVSKGSTITKATIEFQLKEIASTAVNTAAVNVIIEGQLNPNPPAFASTAKNITDRPRTKAQVKWTIPTGMAVGDKFKTPDISPILTELISQDGWVNGNAVVIILRDDKDNPSTGIRCTHAYNGNAAAAPLLHIEDVDPFAYNPSPANGAVDVAPTMALFTWSAGDGAVSHNVYIGTSKDLTAADLVAPNWGAPAYFYPAGIKAGTTYYWRIDEVDSARKVSTGPLWTFTTAFATATVPSPADGAVWQRTDTKVSWRAGMGAVSHKVYGSVKKAAVAAGDPNALLGIQAETSLTLPKLTPLTVYYWRVDEVDAAGAAAPGPVWSLLVAGANTGAWKTAAAAANPGYLATFVADGVYDIGTFNGEMTYEFIVRGNPAEIEPSQCLIGRRDVGDTKVGLKYEQWNNTKTYGATVFGVADYDFKVPNAPGEYTHLVFVSSKTAKKTDLYVNGVLKGNVATDVTLSGQVGIGYGLQNRPPAAPYFDNFDGNIFGVAIYDRILTAAEIAANSTAFLVGGPIAVALDIKLAVATDDTEEYVGTGAMSPTSSDLEMPYENSVGAGNEQLVGVRYFLAVAKGTKITKAYVEFTCDELTLGTQPVNLVIDGQLIANAPAFTSTAKDISSRTTVTKALVQWAVENWTTVGQKSKTPDLSAIIQELVNQDGWASGNAIALILSDDKTKPSAGLRCADAYEDGAALAPVLHLEVLLPWEQ